MPSTLRLYVNDKRISTAVKITYDNILQVYPSKLQFRSENEWRIHWENELKPKITVKVDEPNPSIENWDVTQYWNIIFSVPKGTYFIGDLEENMDPTIVSEIYGATDFTAGFYREKGSDRCFGITYKYVKKPKFKGSDGKVYNIKSDKLGICSQSLVKNTYGGHIFTFDTEVICRFSAGNFEFEWKDGYGYKTMTIDTRKE